MKSLMSGSLLGPGPHLPPLPLEPPHALLPPLGSHDWAKMFSVIDNSKFTPGLLNHIYNRLDVTPHVL